MSLLPFGNLPPYKSRAFVPEKIPLDQWDRIAPLFDELEHQAALMHRPPEMEEWLLRVSELNSALAEESARRYIAMTAHTENPDAEKAYLDFVENIEPKLKPRQFKLKQIFLAHPLRELLPRDRYRVFLRNTAVDVELFREENVPLETEESKLGQQYQKRVGSLTVDFQGEERTLAQMGRFLEETDRTVRREAWELASRRRLQEAEPLNALFDRLLGLRKKIAANAGFASYRDYAFRALHRFDYSPEDCERFHGAVEEVMVPLVRQLRERRKKTLGLDQLRPWDLSVDPRGRPPLRPFENVETMVESTRRICDRLDPDLGERFTTLRRLKLLDLGNRKGKAPGGYQSTLEEARLPFIFMNAVGVQRDVETLLHESGHAFHALATQAEDFEPYRDPPIEFCEVASMSMELLGNEHIDVFYDRPEETRRARRAHLEGIIELFPWIATVDAFQHWLYTHPEHSSEDRNTAWLELMDRFGGDVDWTGHEAVKAHSWHKQLHIFLYPFYYIEYGIAQLGALQVWRNWKNNPSAALENYKKALGLGGSRTLPELFSAAGCRFQFDAETMRPLAELLQAELNLLNESTDPIPNATV